MGLFWDLIQQSQIGEQRQRATSLEARVAALETQVAETRRLLTALLKHLETHFGKDIDRDGKVG
ncbi:MAG TPA: hypothetical protein VGA02_02660 [Gemmatimonadales bacterium]|jgi:hypothetical protein